MRFSIRALLLIVVFLAICFAIVANLTHDYRERSYADSDLRSMGAYYVGFNEKNKPDWIAFVVPVGSARIAQYQSFRHIDFTGAHVTADSLRFIAALKRVDSIDFTNCDITDIQIGLLTKIGNVKLLRLNRTSVTDAAIPAISSIAGLKSVDLSGTLVTDKGVATLGELCPGIFVHR